MDAVPDESRIIKPVGFGGLCLGLIGIAVFTLMATTFFVAIAAAVAALAVGWTSGSVCPVAGKRG